MTLNVRTSLFASSLVVLVAATQPACASSIVTEWLDQTIPAAKQTAWEPTVGARFFALVDAAMYDAWTAYDPVAVGVFTGTSLRGTGGPSTVVNKREAVSYAVCEVRSADISFGTLQLVARSFSLAVARELLRSWPCCVIGRRPGARRRQSCSIRRGRSRTSFIVTSWIGWPLRATV